MKKTLLVMMLFVFIGIMGFSFYKFHENQKYQAYLDQIAKEQQDSYISEELVEEAEYGVDIAIKEQDKIKTRTYDHKALLAKNKDYVGWLYIPKTPIDYPVVVGEKYLKTSFDGKTDIAGTPFVDTGYDPLQKYLVIFGHNMGPGKNTMFSSISKYKDQSFFETHGDLYFNEIESIEKERPVRYRILGFMEYDYRKIKDYQYVKTDFHSEEEFDDYIKKSVSYMKHYSPDILKIKYNKERLLVISTCDTDALGRTDYKRLVLFAISD